MYPGITWREFFEMGDNQKLSGWWTDLKKGTSSVYEGTKQMIGDTVKGLGDVGGSTVRLLSDEQVSSTVSRAGAAYATGGSSEGLAAIFAALGSGGKQLIESAGGAYKSTGLPAWSMYVALGGGVLALIYFLNRD